MTQHSLKLFFALWPDAATRDMLDGVAAQAHQTARGKRVPREALHLTLSFLGATPLSRLDALRAIAAGVRGKSFTLTLDRLGCWSPQKIVWLGIKQIPPALAQLAADVRIALDAGGFRFDARTYVPHVTRVRHADCGGMGETTVVQWGVQNFALLASRPGRPGYDLLGTWPLEH